MTLLLCPSSREDAESRRRPAPAKIGDLSSVEALTDEANGPGCVADSSIEVRARRARENGGMRRSMKLSSCGTAKCEVKKIVRFFSPLWFAGLRDFQWLHGLIALRPRGPTAAFLAAPGPGLRGGLGGFSGVLVTPLDQNFLSHRRRGKYFLASRSVTRTASQRFSTLTDGWPAMLTRAPRNASSQLFGCKIPAHADDKHFIHVYLAPCKDFFVHTGNTSILATRLKPRAQVMDVHDRTSQHFLHSSPILRGTLKGKDQTVIPNNRSILHTDTPPRTCIKLTHRERSTTPQLITNIN